MKKQIDPNLDNMLDELLDTEPAKDSQADSQAEDNITEQAVSSSENEEFTINEPEKQRVEKAGFELAENSNGVSHHHHSSSSHHHSSHHSSSKKKNKKKLSTSAKIALVFLLILLFVVIVVIGAVMYLELSGKNDLTTVDTNSKYRETIEYKGETYQYNDNMVAIAFLGVDKNQLGTDNGKVGTAGQSDADIILAIDTKTGKTKAISVPRDTMVDVDTYTESGIFLKSTKMQLCLSYAYGDGKQSSADNVITSMSRVLLDIPISKYFALDIDGIKAINDSIGGVTLTSISDLPNIKKGEQVHLVGDLTEEYVRSRDVNTIDSALERSNRQVQYIKAFTSQVVDAAMKDFNVVTALYNKASDYSSTNISLSNATYLATLLLQNGVTSFDTVTIEGEMIAGTNTNPEVVFAEFYPDEDSVMQVVLDTFYVKK